MNLQMEGNAVIETNLSSCAESMQWDDEHFDGRYKLPALSMDELGFIQDCSDSCEMVFGYPRRDLLLQHVTKLFPQLSGAAFVKEGRFKPLLDYFCHCGHSFQAQNRQGDTFSSRLSLVRLVSNGRRTVRLIVRPSDGVGA